MKNNNFIKPLFFHLFMPKERLLKGKKKQWHQILAPKLFNNQVLGESLVSNAELLIGKSIRINLMNLVRDPKKSNINLTFVVDNIKEGKGITKIIGYEIIPTTVKRIVKRGRNKIELSFLCLTSDNTQTRIKPLVTTRAMTKGSVLSTLRKAIIDELTKTASTLNFEELMTQIVSHKVQTVSYTHLTLPTN